jgi:hypothetical protein
MVILGVHLSATNQQKANLEYAFAANHSNILFIFGTIYCMLTVALRCFVDARRRPTTTWLYVGQYTKYELPV